MSNSSYDSSLPYSLQQFVRSASHTDFLNTLKNKEKLLIIQDLDGVCMELKRDPKQRVMDSEYIRAVHTMAGEFYVLTNGEHVGSRGVNAIVDTAFAHQSSGYAAQQQLYLPGLAAGGVQWQNARGELQHPGVSQSEMEFLQSVPEIMTSFLTSALSTDPFNLNADQIASILDVIVLDNLASPTLNIGSLHDDFGGNYPRMQVLAEQLMELLLQKAREAGLQDSFFVHLAPNLGIDRSSEQTGKEKLKPAQGDDMGTTDFQFMLRGAVKEAGVLVLLNRYYFAQCGEYPLGADFSVRTAPRTHDAMLALATDAFDPALMPAIVGVGDTLTSVADKPAESSESAYARGGSDRGFLTLVQQLGQAFSSDNAVVWVDSSGGELNRPGISPPPQEHISNIDMNSLQGITDPSDLLQLNVIFPQGYQQYTDFFIALAAARQKS
ncbi:MAG: glucosylglycerol 3-phosphatase [Oceanospirillaceae bacterium]|uniref:glucosylglycerol 3-phosphatase n=1 Tax=unclassified Thalassolituus TaxID=2624967 RepID=UPI000C3C755A|nr:MULTISPECIES: glucosylglycerol 3-phosphatase [unclassified Thalassolituus]MAY01255.1 glucosylglycerol 3-phosphatase [Oceanospirillaceae bacterium]MBS53578.1 glucosylglycerol 3-phosphatase [Oceanospirillaceae bacterium]|tara:strand:- start:7083 stop:8396 length:1314 start_codon:yes stop_codon:yes gene_type:complete